MAPDVLLRPTKNASSSSARTTYFLAEPPRIGLGGLAPPDPSSGLGGLTLSPRHFQLFCKNGRRVDDLDAPSEEFVARALFHVSLRGNHWIFPVKVCASDPVAASVFAALTARLPTCADGTDHGQYAVSSALSSPALGDNTPHPSSVAAPASSTVALDKDALGAIPTALPVHKDSVARQMDSGPQAPPAVPHLASRVARNNRAQVPVVPTVPPLLPSPSETALLSFLPSAYLVSDPPPPSHRCWQASGRRGLRVQ